MTDASGFFFFSGCVAGASIIDGKTVNSVPEPGSAMLLFLGGLALLRG